MSDILLQEILNRVQHISERMDVMSQEVVKNSIMLENLTQDTIQLESKIKTLEEELQPVHNHIKFVKRIGWVLGEIGRAHV